MSSDSDLFSGKLCRPKAICKKIIGYENVNNIISSITPLFYLSDLSLFDFPPVSKISNLSFQIIRLVELM